MFFSSNIDRDVKHVVIHDQVKPVMLLIKQYPKYIKILLLQRSMFVTLHSSILSMNVPTVHLEGYNSIESLVLEFGYCVGFSDPHQS